MKRERDARKQRRDEGAPMDRASAVFAALSLSLACSCSVTRSQPAPGESVSAPVASASVASASASVAPVASAGTLAIGERITSAIVPLADIAKDPAHYQDRVFATSGKVTAVCQEMGCWMQLEDASGRAHVRMHGHTFFVPRTSPGHIARVQATLVKTAAGADGCEEGKCEEGKTAAKLELDATGVEID
jgi:hypothetical protein